MRKFLVTSLMILTAFPTFANDCAARRIIETQKFQARKEYVDNLFAPVVKDVRGFLKTITAQERAIIQKETMASSKLKDLHERGSKMAKKYSAPFHPCGKDQLFYDDKCWQKEPRQLMPLKAGQYATGDYIKNIGYITINVRDVSAEDSGKWLNFNLQIGRPNQQEQDIKASIESHYLAPTLEQYLAQVLPHCKEKKSKASVNANERGAIKDLPAIPSGPSEINSGSKAIKN